MITIIYHEFRVIKKRLKDFEFNSLKIDWFNLKKIMNALVKFWLKIALKIFVTEKANTFYSLNSLMIMEFTIMELKWGKCYYCFRLNISKMISASILKSFSLMYAIIGLAIIICVASVEAELQLVNVVRSTVAYVRLVSRV